MKQKLLFLLFFGFALAKLYAQQSTNAGGGDAAGIGGTTSYSLGQVFYTSNNNSNGTVAQGVQQPYEIATLSGKELAEISLTMQAYPNPATNYLTLNVGENERSNLAFKLVDLNGRSIENRRISTAIETIDMQRLPAAVYFLKVSRNNREIKNFSIIKK
jgi:hypothetical protein